MRRVHVCSARDFQSSLVSLSRCDFSTMKVVETGSELGSRGGVEGGRVPGAGVGLSPQCL